MAGGNRPGDGYPRPRGATVTVVEFRQGTPTRGRTLPLMMACHYEFD